ncbi:AfsR/SARP family transcriptional regulator [Kitasatospora acidiphila]|nr:BTAD domain-containing putative transcriptional regulator [Kitasatospora acidiphila]
MRFGLLGPIELSDGDGRSHVVPAAKQRALLACLLVRPNQHVTMDTLIDMLWDGAAPPSARAAVLNYVTRLRRQLGPELAARVRTEAGGYRLELRAADEADHLQAGALEQRARRAVTAGDWPMALELAGQAMELWRGEPLQDVPFDRLRAEHVPPLSGLQLRLEELRIDAALGAARFDQAAQWLAELLIRHPLREPLQLRKLVALHSAGQRAEALADYHRFCGLLRAELGVGPSQPLQTAHELILRDAAAGAVLEVWRSAQRLPAGAAGPVAAARFEPPPRQLPRAPRLLVGREAESKELGRLLAPATDCQVALLTGPAGVGKTTLALAWAHHAADRFPDGQLFVDLKGHAADGPVDPRRAVSVLLDCLGVPSDRQPATFEGRTALYRSTVAGRRLLFVFDDARDAEQVRPLLPPGTNCRTVVTSRQPLAALVVADGAEPLPLERLSPDGARELLVHRLGAARTSGQEAALARLVERCGRLPLALAVVAADAATMPQLSLEALAADTAHLNRLLTQGRSAGRPADAAR